MLLISKKLYYKKFFAANNCNIKETWKGIKQIISFKFKSSNAPHILEVGTTNITDKKNTANVFNNYFVTIGPELAAKIPLAGATFDKYMPDPVRNSCFLFPVTTSEIEYIIHKLNTSKSTGPFSIPTKLLKMLKCLLSPPLEYLFNYSFSIGKVPNKLKTARYFVLV